MKIILILTLTFFIYTNLFNSERKDRLCVLPDIKNVKKSFLYALKNIKQNLKIVSNYKENKVTVSLANFLKLRAEKNEFILFNIKIKSNIATYVYYFVVFNNFSRINMIKDNLIKYFNENKYSFKIMPYFFILASGYSIRNNFYLNKFAKYFLISCARFYSEKKSQITLLISKILRKEYPGELTGYYIPAKIYFKKYKDFKETIKYLYFISDFGLLKNTNIALSKNLLYYLGISSYKLGHFEKALLYLEKCLKLIKEPAKKVKVLFYLSCSNYKMYFMYSSAKCMERAIKIDLDENLNLLPLLIKKAKLFKRVLNHTAFYKIKKYLNK